MQKRRHPGIVAASSAFASAVAVAGLLFWPTASTAGGPDTCQYRSARLAQACRTDPTVQNYLKQPQNALVEDYMRIPPSVRGWEPGEEAALAAILADSQAGCGYEDADLAKACRLDPEIRDALAARRSGADASWFVLPFDIGGWAPQSFDRRRLSTHPGATRQRFEWGLTGSRQQRLQDLERAMSRAANQRVRFVRAYLVAVDGTDFVACGYAFADGGGKEPESAGRFVLDTQGATTLQASRDLFNALCGVSDVVLR